MKDQHCNNCNTDFTTAELQKYIVDNAKQGNEVLTGILIREIDHMKMNYAITCPKCGENFHYYR